MRLARPGAGPEALLLQLLRGVPPGGSGGRWPAPEDPRWEGALGLAERHGVAPLLHASASVLAHVPRQVVARLKQARVAELRREQQREAVLTRALTALAGDQGSAPVPALLIKGAASARTLYPAPELRPRADLDLLVLPRDAALARERLARAGFVHHAVTRGTPEDDPAWHEHTLHDPDAAEAVIDLHQGLLQRERHGLPPGPLLLRGVREPGLPGATLLPAPEDALLVCALSLAAHELQSPLVVASDLARLLPRCDQRLLAARAREGRVARALALALTWLLLVAGGEAGAEVVLLADAPVERARVRGLLALLGLRSPTWLLLDRLAGRYDLRRLPLARPEQLARKALLLDRPADVARFAVATLRRGLGRRLHRVRPAE